MSFHIQVDTERAVVMMWAEGLFDLSTGFAVYQYCQPEERRYHHYILNLARVSELRDSGLSWLRTFIRRAKEAEIRVDVINVKPEHRQRCSEWRIPVYTPGDHPALLGLGDSGLEPIEELDLGVPIPKTVRRVDSRRS